MTLRQLAHFTSISSPPFLLVFIAFPLSPLCGLRKYFPHHQTHLISSNDVRPYNVSFQSSHFSLSLTSSASSWPRKIIIQIPTNVKNGWASSRLAATPPAPTSLLCFDPIPTVSATKWNGKHHQNNNKWKNDAEMAMERRRRRKENCLTIFFLVTQQ